MRVRKNKNTKDHAVPSADTQLPNESSIGIIKAGRKLHAARLRMIILITLTALAIALAAWFIVNRTNDNKDEDRELPNETTLLESELQQTQASKPPKDASIKEQTSYFDKVFLIQYEKKDYRAATAAFEERIAISTDGIDYNLCYWAVLAYKNMGDKAGALRALDVMQKSVPPDDQENGFFAENVFALIERTRKELQ